MLKHFTWEARIRVLLLLLPLPSLCVLGADLQQFHAVVVFPSVCTLLTRIQLSWWKDCCRYTGAQRLTFRPFRILVRRDFCTFGSADINAYAQSGHVLQALLYSCMCIWWLNILNTCKTDPSCCRSNRLYSNDAVHQAAGKNPINNKRLVTERFVLSGAENPPRRRVVYLLLLVHHEFILESSFLRLPVGGQLQPLVLLHHFLMIQFTSLVLQTEERERSGNCDLLGRRVNLKAAYVWGRIQAQGWAARRTNFLSVTYNLDCWLAL